jgi:hypothetical protein
MRPRSRVLDGHRDRLGLRSHPGGPTTAGRSGPGRPIPTRVRPPDGWPPTFTDDSARDPPTGRGGDSPPARPRRATRPPDGAGRGPGRRPVRFGGSGRSGPASPPGPPCGRWLLAATPGPGGRRRPTVRQVTAGPDRPDPSHHRPGIDLIGTEGCVVGSKPPVVPGKVGFRASLGAWRLERTNGTRDPARVSYDPSADSFHKRGVTRPNPGTRRRPSG